jgi:hypothetical protein
MRSREVVAEARDHVNDGVRWQCPRIELGFKVLGRRSREATDRVDNEEGRQGSGQAVLNRR